MIVNVETNPATTPDDVMVAVIHASLAKRDWLPPLFALCLPSGAG